MNNVPEEEPQVSRRALVLGAVAAGVLAACGGNGDSQDGAAAQAPTSTAGNAPATTPPSGTPTTGAAPAQATTLAPTPECRDADDVTPAQTEGPYFKANSPERTNIRADGTGTKLLLTGTVVNTACQPVSRALVDFWQADGAGNYDNASFRFRGHQFTDAQGRYQLETVMPGLYTGRTRHIHVKVQAPGGRVLTTQLYFPGEARNASDGIYRAELVVDDLADAADGKRGTFMFVLT